MSDNLSNDAQPLSTNPKGSPADGQKMRSDATGTSYTVPSAVTINVKQVDHLTIEGSNPGDHRSGQIAVPAVPQPAPRGETGQAGA